MQGYSFKVCLEFKCCLGCIFLYGRFVRSICFSLYEYELHALSTRNFDSKSSESREARLFEFNGKLISIMHTNSSLHLASRADWSRIGHERVLVFFLLSKLTLNYKYYKYSWRGKTYAHSFYCLNCSVLPLGQKQIQRCRWDLDFSRFWFVFIDQKYIWTADKLHK